MSMCSEGLNKSRGSVPASGDSNAKSLFESCFDSSGLSKFCLFAYQTTTCQTYCQSLHNCTLGAFGGVKSSASLRSGVFKLSGSEAPAGSPATRPLRRSSYTSIVLQTYIAHDWCHLGGRRRHRRRRCIDFLAWYLWGIEKSGERITPERSPNFHKNPLPDKTALRIEHITLCLKTVYDSCHLRATYFDHKHALRPSLGTYLHISTRQVTTDSDKQATSNACNCT